MSSAKVPCQSKSRKRSRTRRKKQRTARSHEEKCARFPWYKKWLAARRRRELEKQRPELLDLEAVSDTTEADSSPECGAQSSTGLSPHFLRLDVAADYADAPAEPFTPAGCANPMPSPPGSRQCHFFEAPTLRRAASLPAIQLTMRAPLSPLELQRRTASAPVEVLLAQWGGKGCGDDTSLPMAESSLAAALASPREPVLVRPSSA